MTAPSNYSRKLLWRVPALALLLVVLSTPSQVPAQDGDTQPFSGTEVENLMGGGTQPSDQASDQDSEASKWVPVKQSAKRVSPSPAKKRKGRAKKRVERKKSAEQKKASARKKTSERKKVAAPRKARRTKSTAAFNTIEQRRRFAPLIQFP